MAQGARDEGRSEPGPPTLADMLARRLAGTILAWATGPILGFVVLLAAVALFAAVGGLLVVIVAIANALKLTSSADGSSGSTGAVLIVALVIVGVVLFRPVRWFARNLLRAERHLDSAVDRLAVGATLETGTFVESRPRPTPMTSEELARLDARLAPSPEPLERADHLDQARPRSSALPVATTFDGGSVPPEQRQP